MWPAPMAGFRIGGHGLDAAVGRVAHRIVYLPHLHSFTERIRIDGRAIPEPDMVALVDLVRAVVGTLPVTFLNLQLPWRCCIFTVKG